ncbi:hypothetical protein WJX84_000782 [Apatococcus fuscideae]|uniref:Transmembrane protein 242 n=1 Tax=Apatococcus fuscideae TaxID=2026836 RepID=A0AAW1TG90_9CHLO
MPDTHDRDLSPLQGALCGIGAMLASALAVGAAHFRFTGKQLVAEGIDLKSRARAFPVAGRALAVSSGICITAGLAGVLILQNLDIKRRDVARVSVPEAIHIVKDQQVVLDQDAHWRQTSSSKAGRAE